MASVHLGGDWVAHWLGGRLPPERAIDAGRWLAERDPPLDLRRHAAHADAAPRRPRYLPPRALAFVLVAIVVGDVGLESARLCDFVPSSLYTETPPPIAAARAVAGSGPLRLYRPSQIAFDAPGIPAQALLRGTLRPDCGVEDGISQVDAYDNFPVAHEAALWAALTRRPLRLLS